jgi:hypothetical protein
VRSARDELRAVQNEKATVGHKQPGLELPNEPLAEPRHIAGIETAEDDGLGRAELRHRQVRLAATLGLLRPMGSGATRLAQLQFGLLHIVLVELLISHFQILLNRPLLTIASNFASAAFLAASFGYSLRRAFS